MDMINKIKIDIAGAKYVINSKEEPDYVKKLADEINRNVECLIENCSNLSLNDSLVLTVLNYADSYKKSEQNADHLRSQLTDYLEDSARYRIQAEEAKREIQTLQREIQALQREIEQLKEENK